MFATSSQNYEGYRTGVTQDCWLLSSSVRCQV